MSSILAVAFGGCAALSAVLGLWQWLVAWRFPLHQRRAIVSPLPGVTVLKPIKGCDRETDACLRSWFAQEYSGPIQILVGVASLDDPAVPLVKRLIEEYPAAHGRLVHCGQSKGINAKVSTLIQLHGHAVHHFLCVSDADVWAPSDFLAQACTRATDPGVGLVNSFYQVKAGPGLGMQWEALAINADFWSQVLQSASLQSVDFALGAAMVFRRREFEEAGGFQALADLLADDFHLGHNLASRGSRIELLPVVVECRSQLAGLGEAWLHQLRWARTIRACRPVPYFFSILANGSIWPLMAWLTTVGKHPLPATITLCALLALRSVEALSLVWRLTQRWDLAVVWLAWIKDLLHLGTWFVSFLGNTVIWRDVRYRVDRRGKLTRL